MVADYPEPKASKVNCFAEEKVFPINWFWILSFSSQANLESLASLTPDQVMDQLNKVDSQQKHFRFVPKSKPNKQQLAAAPAYGVPYGAPRSVVVRQPLYGGPFYSIRPPPLLPMRAAPIPLPSIPPLSKQLDAIEGMQGRYQFAPERDALYAGQGFRQAAQDTYDGVYGLRPRAFATAQPLAEPEAPAPTIEAPTVETAADEAPAPAPSSARHGGRAHLGAVLSTLATDEAGSGKKKSGRAHVDDGGGGAIDAQFQRRAGSGLRAARMDQLHRLGNPPQGLADDLAPAGLQGRDTRAELLVQAANEPRHGAPGHGRRAAHRQR